MEPVTPTELPPDLITTILHRLPSKSLTRFRSVSKHWLTQLTNPHFIKLHQQTLNRHHILYTHHNTSLYSHDLTNTSPPGARVSCISIFHGSCNGLVLGSKDDVIYSHSLVVVNPSINEFINIPEPGSKPGFEMLSNLLDIDIVYGFGYDMGSDDYKIVTVSYFHYSYLIPPDSMCVHVYSVRNNAWTRAVDSPFDHVNGMSVEGVFVGGFIHWVACKGEHRVPVIAAFSLKDEVFGEVAFPGSVDVECMRGCRVVGGGEKLGLLMEGEVWVMREYGVRESWVKVSIRGFDKSLRVDSTVLCEDGKMVLVSGGLVRVYDVGEESFGESIEIFRNSKGFKVKGVYVESLVSPKLR